MPSTATRNPGARRFLRRGRGQAPPVRRAVPALAYPLRGRRGLRFQQAAGLAVQGGSGLTRHVDALLEALRDRKGQKPRLVHRLDRDTSGVLVVARTRLAAQKLAASFRTRSTRKIYWALVKGVPKPRQGRISTWLAKDGGPEGEKMRVARHGEDDASHAVSLYSVIETAGQSLSWLSMRPVTGRTHQLRAHAAHIGHPIVGDPKYFEAAELVSPGRHAEQASSPRPADRHSAPLGWRGHRRFGAASPAYGAELEPARPRPVARRYARR